MEAQIILPRELSDALKAAIKTAAQEIANNSVQNNNVPLYLSKKEAADYLGVAPNTLDKWIHDGVDIPYKHIGKTYRFNRNDLDKFMATK
ncbi:helix-turn-helix domain-containing protein [Limosilactobacillus pontis]|uniref:helix-turn-helix domain-containing protein n=1 Tax=Limosilactobacillus pontis TaxID=35787 RepID=UPI00241C6ABF|nr:helix-turn-helix domain-containing protein [Limosilactobacillus pontis]